QIFDVVIVPPDNNIGIVQEYVPGDDVRKLAKTWMPTPADYLHKLYQIASGIADIHAVGQIHRDIKPINMKVDAEGLVKIFDFGLSREHTADKAHTFGFKGTRGYAAPELYGDGDRPFTPAVDTYAFGV